MGSDAVIEFKNETVVVKHNEKKQILKESLQKLNERYYQDFPF